MDNKDVIEQQVKKALEQMRPLLQEDGGDVEYVDMTNEGVVMIRLQGMCHGCPHAMTTVKQFIERTICEAIPQVRSVEKI